MSDLTNFAENKIIDAVLRGQAIDTPANWHIALATAVADAEAGSFTEATGTGYAREAVAASLAAWSGTQSTGSTAASSGSGGRSSNNAVISFGTAGAGGWGTVTHVVFMDAASGGNAWLVRALAVSKTINAGDPVTFPANSLGVTAA
ncbi:MAG: hypothetical protein K2X74_00445 [Acetobacteraceae bacterium]|nr:hypothetical protein [Acetobacteraceae bacterium]